eukprot:12418916-Alexandrium_andersonii.AAC.1
MSCSTAHLTAWPVGWPQVFGTLNGGGSVGERTVRHVTWLSHGDRGASVRGSLRPPGRFESG